MRRLLRSKRALSTVVTTLIILVVSVLLATVVTYYAINVTSTRVQEESLHLSKQHVWHNGLNMSEAALMVINTGGRDVVIDKLSVRGQECYWNSSALGKYVVYCKTTDAISADLPFVSNFNQSGVNRVRIGGTLYNFTVASDDLILQSGWTMIIYVVNPDSISVNDIGLTVGISLFTAQAIYYRETNVQATT